VRCQPTVLVGGSRLPVELLTVAEGFGDDSLFQLPDIREVALYAQHTEHGDGDGL